MVRIHLISVLVWRATCGICLEQGRRGGGCCSGITCLAFLTPWAQFSSTARCDGDGLGTKVGRSRECFVCPWVSFASSLGLYPSWVSPLAGLMQRLALEGLGVPSRGSILRPTGMPPQIPAHAPQDFRFSVRQWLYKQRALSEWGLP